MIQATHYRSEDVRLIGERILLSIKDKEGKLMKLSPGDCIAFRRTDGAFSVFRDENASPIRFGCAQDDRLPLFVNHLSKNEARDIAKIIANSFSLHLKPGRAYLRKNRFYFTFTLVKNNKKIAL